MKWHLVNNLVLGKYSMCDSWVRPLSVHKFSRPYQGVANRELEIATLSIQMQPKEQYLYHACVLRAHLTANTSASNQVRFYGRLGGGAYVNRTVALNVKFRERPRFCFPAGNCGLVRLDEVFSNRLVQVEPATPIFPVVAHWLVFPIPLLLLSTKHNGSRFRFLKSLVWPGLESNSTPSDCKGDALTTRSRSRSRKP